MKKLLALLLTLTLSLGLLAGCGQTEPTAEDTPDTQTETDTQNNTGDLRKITITEQVRGYHWAPAYLAQSLGYFAVALAGLSHGHHLSAFLQTIAVLNEDLTIRVNVLDGFHHSGSHATAPVLSGDAQFTLKGIETALMVNEGGQGCKVVLSTTQKYPYQLIGATEEYSTLESLEGGLLAGGQSTNSGPYSFAQACINYAGLEGKVEISTMASSGYAAAIANGELQGAISTNPWSAKQLTDAGGVVIVDGTDDGVIEDIIGSASYELFTVITSDALIESDPELVQSAVNAMAKAIQWMQTATPEEIAAQLGTLFDGATEEELLYDAQFDKDHQVATTDGYHTDSGFQAAINLTKLAGGITGDPTADQIFDESFLDKAWENLGQ